MPVIRAHRYRGEEKQGLKTKRTRNNSQGDRFETVQKRTGLSYRLLPPIECIYATEALSLVPTLSSSHPSTNGFFHRFPRNLCPWIRTKKRENDQQDSKIRDSIIKNFIAINVHDKNSSFAFDPENYHLNHPTEAHDKQLLTRETCPASLIRASIPRS